VPSEYSVLMLKANAELGVPREEKIPSEEITGGGYTLNRLRNPQPASMGTTPQGESISEEKGFSALSTNF